MPEVRDGPNAQVGAISLGLYPTIRRTDRRHRARLFAFVYHVPAMM